MPDDLSFDADASIERLMRFLAVEGVPGELAVLGPDGAPRSGSR